MPPKAATPAATQASQNKIKKIHATDNNIERHLKDRDIVMAERDKKPQNYEAIMELVEKYRFMGSQKELEAKADKYQTHMEESDNEHAATQAIHFILDTGNLYGHKFLKFGGENLWNKRVKPFLEIENEDLRPPKPDFSLGIHERLLPNLALRSLGGYALLSKAKQVMPFLTMEAKSVEKNTKQAMSQNLYNGAIMVNNMLHLKTKLGSESEFYGFAKVFSFSFDQFDMRISAHWVERIDGELKFFGRRIKAWNLECDTLAYVNSRQGLVNVIDELEHTLGPEIVKDIEKLQANLIAQGITIQNVQPDDNKPVGWEGTVTGTESRRVDNTGTTDD